MGVETAAVGALMARARRRVEAHFTDAKAISATSAVAFTPNHRMERRYFERLCDAGVIRTAGVNRYFIDETALAAHRATRRKRAGFIFGGLAAVIAVAAGVGLIGGG